MALTSSDEEALLLQLSADVSKLQKSFDKAVSVVNSGSGQMERRAKQAATNIEGSFAGIGIEKSLGRVFDASRLTILEEGAARLRIFGSALEPLGPLGITAAAGVFAFAVAASQVSKAVAEVAELKDTADRLNIPVEALQELQYAALETHVPVKALDQALINLNETLGRLRQGGNARLQKLADELGLQPADLQNVKDANDLLPILADRIKALPSLSDQYAAAAKANVLEILPLLLLGGDGIKKLQQQYKDLGTEVDGPTAEAIKKANEELERADKLASDKVRKSLLGLTDTVIGLKIAWADTKSAVIDAMAAMLNGYEAFVRKASQLANQDTGHQLQDFGAHVLGVTNLALARPGTAIGAALGFPGAQQEFLHGPGYAQPSVLSALPATAAEAGAPGKPQPPTPAMLAAEADAKKKLDEIEAKFLTHTTSRLEAEKAIEEINKKRAAAGLPELDKATADKIIAGAKAADAKRNRPPTDTTTAQDAAAKQAYEAALRTAQEAQLRLGGTIAERADLQQKVLDAERDQKLAELDHKAAEIQNQRNDTNKKAQLAELRKAAAEVQNAYLAETEANRRQAAVDTINEIVDQQRAQSQARVSQLDADQAHYTALADLATTLQARAEFERKALKAQQDREDELADAKLKEALAHLAKASETNDPHATQVATAEVNQALADKGRLGQQHADQNATLAKQTENPFAQYERSIDDLNTKMEEAGVTAAHDLASGLADAIVHAKNLGEVARSVFQQLVADLIQAVAEKTIVKTALAIFGFAKGTKSAPGGPAVVGEEGPELVNLPAGGGSVIVGQKGPEVVDLPAGSEVVPNNELKERTEPKAGALPPPTSDAPKKAETLPAPPASDAPKKAEALPPPPALPPASDAPKAAPTTIRDLVPHLAARLVEPPTTADQASANPAATPSKKAAGPSLRDLIARVYQQPEEDAAEERKPYGGRQFRDHFSPALPSLPRFAAGTDFAAGGPALVGEEGPEIINLPTGAQVIPNRTLTALAGMTLPQAGPTTVDYRMSIDLRGANGDATIRKLAREAAAQGAAAAYAAAMRDVPTKMARNARRRF